MACDPSNGEMIIHSWMHNVCCFLLAQANCENRKPNRSFWDLALLACGVAELNAEMILIYSNDIRWLLLYRCYVLAYRRLKVEWNSFNILRMILANRERTKFIGHRWGQFVAYASARESALTAKSTVSNLMVKSNRSHAKTSKSNKIPMKIGSRRFHIGTYRKCAHAKHSIEIKRMHRPFYPHNDRLNANGQQMCNE